MIGAVIASRDDDEAGGDPARELLVEVTGRDRTAALHGMQAVGFGVGGVVHHVRGARSEAERDERDEGLGELIGLGEHTRCCRGREHEDVLDPLLRPGGAHDGPDDGLAWLNSGRVLRRGFGDRGHRTRLPTAS